MDIIKAIWFFIPKVYDIHAKGMVLTLILPWVNVTVVRATAKNRYTARCFMMKKGTAGYLKKIHNNSLLNVEWQLRNIGIFNPVLIEFSSAKNDVEH